MWNSSIWPIDRTLSGATTLSQIGPYSNCNEEVLRIPQNSSITGASLSDCLVSYPGHSLGVSYPSAEIQSVYSTAPANWATKKCGGVLGMTLNCIWWWSFSSEDLGSVEYPFIAITPKSTLTLNCIWWWSSSSWDLGSVEYAFIAITPRSTIDLTW